MRQVAMAFHSAPSSLTRLAGTRTAARGKK
jgi:hypothetical protein